MPQHYKCRSIPGLLFQKIYQVNSIGTNLCATLMLDIFHNLKMYMQEYLEFYPFLKKPYLYS